MRDCPPEAWHLCGVLCLAFDVILPYRDVLVLLLWNFLRLDEYLCTFSTVPRIYRCSPPWTVTLARIVAPGGTFVRDILRRSNLCSAGERLPAAIPISSCR